MQYGFSKNVSLPYDDAILKTTEELKKEGFGILTEIDIKETLKKKLNVDFNKYKILGACNPPFAHKALEKELELGLLLPCNIIVYEKDEKTFVSIFNPMVMTEIVENPEIKSIANGVEEKLLRVMNNIN
jgi:uncharacterized protein (DUF302 family)